MKVSDKVKVISSPYSMFEVGEVYTVSYVDERPYGIYLTDPFYGDLDHTGRSYWAFHRNEVELVNDSK